MSSFARALKGYSTHDARRSTGQGTLGFNDSNAISMPNKIKKRGMMILDEEHNEATARPRASQAATDKSTGNTPSMGGASPPSSTQKTSQSSACDGSSAKDPAASNASTPSQPDNAIGLGVSKCQTALGDFTGPAFFEICVNRSKNLVSLGEVRLRDGGGKLLVHSDVELFGKVRQRYNELCRRGIYRYLYRPVDVHFVRFAVRRAGHQIGIYESPLAIPPEQEVSAKRYHYHECPLDPLPPIDRRTFFHYFYASETHPHSTGNPALDLLFCNRLPKKLQDSMLNAKDPSMMYGWGIHIIEGPNKPLLAWFAAAILAASFVVALVYDIARGNADSGFGIGQWMVATLSAGLTALYFHLEDVA